MAQFLLQVSYTPEAWAAMLKKPQNRDEAVRPAIEALGGRAEHFWMAFGDYDIIGVIEMPQAVDAAAFSMAIMAGGACKAVKTTPLLSIEQGVEAMRKATTCGYKPATQASGATR
jgi:uncharacterized protein with GYD domain